MSNPFGNYSNYPSGVYHQQGVNTPQQKQVPIQQGYPAHGLQPPHQVTVQHGLQNNTVQQGQVQNGFSNHQNVNTLIVTQGTPSLSKLSSDDIQDIADSVDDHINDDEYWKGGTGTRIIKELLPELLSDCSNINELIEKFNNTVPEGQSKLTNFQVTQLFRIIENRVNTPLYNPVGSLNTAVDNLSQGHNIMWGPTKAARIKEEIVDKLDFYQGENDFLMALGFLIRDFNNNSTSQGSGQYPLNDGQERELTNLARSIFHEKCASSNQNANNNNNNLSISNCQSIQNVQQVVTNNVNISPQKQPVTLKKADDILQWQTFHKWIDNSQELRGKTKGRLKDVLMQCNNGVGPLKDELLHLKNSRKITSKEYDAINDAVDKFNYAGKNVDLAHAWGTGERIKQDTLGVKNSYLGNWMQPSAKFAEREIEHFINTSMNLSDSQKQTLRSLKECMALHSTPPLPSKDQFADEMYNKWYSGEPIIINTGWSGHATAVVIQGNKLIKLNRGQQRGQFAAKVYTFDPFPPDESKFKEAVKKLRYEQQSYNQYNAYVRSYRTKLVNGQPVKIQGGGIDDDLDLKRVSGYDLQMKDQSVGNCSFASKKAGVYAALYLSNLSDEIPEGKAKENAKEVYKSFTSSARLNSLKIAYEMAKEDPSEVDWHILSRVALQLKSKLNKSSYIGEQKQNFDEAAQIMKDLASLARANDHQVDYESLLHFYIATDDKKGISDIINKTNINISHMDTAIEAKSENLLAVLHNKAAITDNEYFGGLVSISLKNKGLWNPGQGRYVRDAMKNPETFLNWVNTNAYLTGDQKKALKQIYSDCFAVQGQPSPTDQFIAFVDSKLNQKGGWGQVKADHIKNAIKDPNKFLDWLKNNPYFHDYQKDSLNSMFNQYFTGASSIGGSNVPPFTYLGRRYGNARTVPGTKIDKAHSDVGIGGFNVQESYGYDWSEQYGKNSTHKTSIWRNSDFADKAKNSNAGALIASNGTLSNFQKVKLKKGGFFGSKTFNTAEHILHYYKVPPNQKDYRKNVLKAEGGGAALKAGGKAKQINDPKNWGEEWGDVSKNLGVYIQLLKASNPDTKMHEVLMNSGDQFIIEDTSYRKEKNHQGNQHNLDPEIYWGDNGDGSGDNKLGWCQMEARRIIRQQFGGQMPTAQQVQDYFDQHVEPQLLNYYQKCWNYNGNKVD